LACALAGSLVIDDKRSGSRPSFRCPACDSDSEEAPSHPQTAQLARQFDDLRDTIESILPGLQGTGKCRVAAMLTVRTLLTHDPDAEAVQIGLSPFSDFCLNSLRSSVRELRIAAGQVIPLDG
jgi:serine/threonine-protein kinase ATR